MAGALLVLEVLVGLSCVVLVFDGLIVLSIIALCAGITLALVGGSIRASEASQAWKVTRIVGPFLLLPALLMLVQCLPNPFMPHSIWSTAAAALNEPISGFITVDPGMTLIALCRYLVILAILIAAVCITIDRRRAESLLFVLAGTCVFLSLVLVVLSIAAPKYLADPAELDLRSALQAIGGLGVLLCATLISRAVEKFEIGRVKVGPGSAPKSIDRMAGLIGLAICVAAVALVASGTMWLAVFCGLLPVLAVPLVRRLARRRIESRIAMVFFVVLAVALLAGRMAQGFGDPTLRIAAQLEPSQASIAQRMLSDTHWLGNGAGTYAALAPFYRGSSDSLRALVPPTSAAAVAAGLGRTALGVIMLLAIGLIVLLFDRALRRGRDSYYPALGAGGVMLMTFSMFTDNSLLATAVLIISCAVVGLSLGQSLSMQHPTEGSGRT